ncbi:hypothetical protein GCM10007978_24130 [Shewanella hanedai]|uniref:DUF559 domain-containing protein n=1 Tax=Shewanella hanedai TaxID=25 RepID=A0A553JMY6_SHEHA|nr:hypothetical protein [Shewanella hanedai]TRY13828.1 hypothetical protein FN961_12990 [Shewanella hanedai]GGI85642.1 hypothetical protein GCM10007978_24130 [Shewanella hanedai]
MNLDEYRQLAKAKPRTGKNKGNAKAQAAKLARDVALHLLELPTYEKEVRFHPVRQWRFDYAWPDLKIALEIHGGVFTDGRHNRGKGFTEDRVKMNSAQLLGWTVIEATTAQVNNGQMLQWVMSAIESRSCDASN